MPQESLEKALARFMTLNEAVEWIEERKEEFGILKAPRPDTLKQACSSKRLGAALKGQLWITREKEIRKYMKRYDPKNKTESRPVKRRKKVQEILEETVEQAELTIVEETVNDSTND